MHEKLTRIPTRSLREVEIVDTESDQLAHRVLILMAFKETNTQNLRFIMNLLGLRTLKEKLAIVTEIFRLIRKGVVYVPEGLPLLIDYRSLLTPEALREVENIDLCLLCPHEKLIQEIEIEVREHRRNKEGASVLRT